MTSPRRPFEVLIAEDNSGDMLLVREALDRQQIPCKLRTATDGAMAIALIEQLDQESPPLLDLVIVDMHLPKYDGVAILERLRSTAHLKATPAIVLSSSAAVLIHNQTTKYGLVFPFNKPSDFNGFMALGRLADSLLRTEMASEANEPSPRPRGRPV